MRIIDQKISKSISFFGPIDDDVIIKITNCLNVSRNEVLMVLGYETDPQGKKAPCIGNFYFNNSVTVLFTGVLFY